MGSNNDHISQEVDNRLDDLFGTEDDYQGGYDGETLSAESIDQPDGIHAADSELENRLDGFFEDEGRQENMAGVEETMTSESRNVSPIERLKSVVLSLEWEITDQIMQKLGEEIIRLEDQYSDDKIVVAFLQLLGSLGKYIRKKRAEAHPESITLLQSVYENLEKAIMDSSLSDADKKKMLVIQVNNYKKLKEDITVARTPSSHAEETHSEDTVSPGVAESDEAESSSADTAEESYDYDDGNAGYDADDPSDDEFGRGGETIFPPDDDNMDFSGMAQNSAGFQDIVQAIESLRQTFQSEISALRSELVALRKSGR